MPHETIKKLIKKIPASEYSEKQEERQKKTKEGQELLEKTKTLKGRFSAIKNSLRFRRKRKTSDGYILE